jgi:hypothetical protein
MHWKAILTILAILALIVVISISPTIKNLFKPLPQLTSFFTFGQPANYTSFILTVDLEDKSVFNGQTYKITNGTVTNIGVFVDDVTIENSRWEKKTKKGEMKFYNFDGEFSITAYGTAKIVGDSTYVLIDGQGIKPSGEKLSVSAEVIPSELLVIPINEGSILLSPVTGKIENVDTGGVQPLKKDSLEITNFVGRLEFTTNSVLLVGSATKITGKGFTWMG